MRRVHLEINPSTCPLPSGIAIFEILDSLNSLHYEIWVSEQPKPQFEIEAEYHRLESQGVVGMFNDFVIRYERTAIVTMSLALAHNKTSKIITEMIKLVRLNSPQRHGRESDDFLGGNLQKTMDQSLISISKFHLDESLKILAMLDAGYNFHQ
ncbi:hypothetical protein WICPIJ_001812 [Wickerhamomyces pijperi]|uniref:Uncharacterized protein n=1 Tax=Wickerhamomyces pijperi TaxID=599730 RepID=A0A9P8QAX9_WICPI|nr:hypothetical protein WICPIJ_001812 [Wickerhamomyces pijperi]